MLIDLERNDIGRVCDYGSVHVDELMITEDYSHVIHIVSNIKGKLAQGKTCFEAIKAAFPGGTITGVPKVRCMEIIDELEPVSRVLHRIYRIYRFFRKYGSEYYNKDLPD